LPTEVRVPSGVTVTIFSSDDFQVGRRGTVWFFEPLTLLTSARVVPAGPTRTACPGTISIAAASTTSTGTPEEISPTEAVTFDFPSLLASTRPASSTSATWGFEDAQVTRPPSIGFPLESSS
jgi:hypothetical protein